MANNANNNTATSWFQGYIDDVRIYNRSLSSQEVRQLYASTNGYALDCQDATASVNPAAAEVCDSADNNCSGGIDEAVTNTYRKDYDGDLRSDGTTTNACTPTSGYALPSNPFLP